MNKIFSPFQALQDEMKYFKGFLSGLAIASSGIAYSQTTETLCEPYNGYVNNNNGTITDPRTKLTWQICAVGQEWNDGKCVGNALNFSKAQAAIAAAENNFANRHDWRIPELGEMLTGINIFEEIKPEFKDDYAYIENFRTPECRKKDPSLTLLNYHEPQYQGEYKYWTSTPIPNENTHYGLVLSYFFEKFNGFSLAKMKTESNLRFLTSARLKLVTGGTPSGDFNSGYFAEVNKNNEQKKAKLKKWRNSKFKVGDDTFCGTIIEARLPMVKIALNTPLPGFASEVWLKTSDLYPVEHGCVNKNGKLSPLNP